MTAAVANIVPADSYPHHARVRRVSGWFEAGKRTLDVAGALVLAIAAAPLLLTVMLWICLVDGRPVLYAQWRVGRDGWLFRIYKLRTMRQDAERGTGPRFSERRDPRVLPGCRWIRKAHVDELPQLWNIIRGEMSLVGPRPERPEMHERLRADLRKIDRRLTAAPGLTGLAQVRNGYSNDLPGMRRKLALDLRYLRRPSLLRDVQLVLLTVFRLWDRRAM